MLYFIIFSYVYVFFYCRNNWFWILNKKPIVIRTLYKSYTNGLYNWPEMKIKFLKQDFSSYCHYNLGRKWFVQVSKTYLNFHNSISDYSNDALKNENLRTFNIVFFVVLSFFSFYLNDQHSWLKITKVLSKTFYLRCNFLYVRNGLYFFSFLYLWAQSPLVLFYFTITFRQPPGQSRLEFYTLCRQVWRFSLSKSSQFMLFYKKNKRKQIV